MTLNLDLKSFFISKMEWRVINMYPFKLKSVYKEKIWAGNKLRNLKKDIKEDYKYGESWEVVADNKEKSIILNGKYKNRSLDELIDNYNEEILGSALMGKKFPLLIKFLDSKEELSIQVHPDDNYANVNENSLGKTEAWYIMDADEDAYLIIGLENCSKKEMEKAIYDESLDQYFKKVEVKAGQVYFIRSGLVHSMKGVLIAEVQQNSDLTYRIYDKNRGRQLHIDDALQVIDLELHSKKTNGLSIDEEDYEYKYFCYNKYFALERIKVKSELSEKMNGERFEILICVENEGIINYENGSIDLKKGETLFLPALMGDYTLKGSFEILKTYVPDLNKIRSRILSYVEY